MGSTEENPGAFVLQPPCVWAALVSEVMHRNNWNSPEKTCPASRAQLITIWSAFCSYLCDKTFYQTCNLQKTHKTQKIYHRTCAIGCLRLVFSYFDQILSSFLQVLRAWLKPLLTNVSEFVLWPFVRSQTGKEPNNLYSTDLITSVFQLILDSEHKTKIVREMGMWCVFHYLSAKKPNKGEIARHTVLGNIPSTLQCTWREEKCEWGLSLTVQTFHDWTMNPQCNLFL